MWQSPAEFFAKYLEVFWWLETDEFGGKSRSLDMYAKFGLDIAAAIAIYDHHQTMGGGGIDDDGFGIGED